MKILIACEESQTVCKEFRKLGHEAYSCDILPCSGGHPEWHLQQDITPLLEEDWDMIIAFPPCTHLAVSGARHFAKKIADGRQQQGIDFFMLFTNCKCPKVVIENPVGIMSTRYKKPSQIIQPYFFGDPYKKTTCLWIKGLPKLESTNIVEVCDMRTYHCKNGKKAIFSDWINKGGKDRQKNRSKTFLGIAKAMAEQWGNLPCTNEESEKARVNTSALLSCGNYFFPWGEVNHRTGARETAWKCGDEWNGKPLLCKNCSPTKTTKKSYPMDNTNPWKDEEENKDGN